jgi:VIT1/CCC1 family predicted Fe2+/Mn2+ transporter
MLVIVVLSYFLARAQQAAPLPVIGEHVGIAAIVVVLSYLIGAWVNRMFG